MKTAISTDAQLKDRLKAVRDQAGDARTRRAEAKKERDAAKEAFAGTDPKDKKITEMPEFEAAEQAVKAVGEIDDELADLKKAEESILDMLGERPDPAGGDPGRHASLEAGSGRAAWDGRALLDRSEAYAAARESGLFTSGAQFGTVTLGQLCGRDNLSQFLAQLPAAPGGPITTTTASGAVPPDIRGIIPPALKPLALLDLIPVGQTDSNIVEYVQVTGLPLSAAETAALAVKPEAGLGTQDATAPVRTIPQYIKAARQQLDDVAGLATLINTLLPYGVRRRIESQMLAGDGTGQNILGLLHTSGVQEVESVSEDNDADSILRAMTAVVLADQEPNFVAANPLTVQDIRMMKASTSGVYLYGAPGDMIAPTIWGLQISQNRIIERAHPIVGDSMGATLLVREGVNVKTSDSDQDDFVRNRVTILAEARVAFPVWRPSAFAIAAKG